MSEGDEMGGARLGLERLLTGVYAWLYAVFLGLIVLDVVYAGQLRAGPDAAAVEKVFSEISDFLLLPYSLLVLAGALALAVGWRNGGIRRLLSISLLLPPAVLAMSVLLGPALEAANLGSAARLLGCLAGSVLAMLAFIGLPVRRVT